MPTIKRFNNFTICMYFDDHGIPHFHIVCREGTASIAIDSLEMLAGNIPASILKEARVWAVEKKALLHATWKEYSQ